MTPEMKADLDISYAWHRVTSDQPSAGSRVMVWHPAYGDIIAYRDRAGGFYEAHLGTQTDINCPIDWWMELPSRPAGEEEPSRDAYLKALSRNRYNQQIGFAAPSSEG